MPRRRVAVVHAERAGELRAGVGQHPDARRGRAPVASPQASITCGSFTATQTISSTPLARERVRHADEARHVLGRADPGVGAGHREEHDLAAGEERLARDRRDAVRALLEERRGGQPVADGYASCALAPFAGCGDRPADI